MILLLAAIVTLETDTTRVAFDPARNGAIVSLVDKASGKEFAASPAVPLLYELRFTNTVTKSTVTWTEADANGARVERDGDAVVITTLYVRRPEADPFKVKLTSGPMMIIGNPAVVVKCRFRTEPKSTFIHGRITVGSQQENFSLASVRFPALAWQKQLGPSPEREFLVLPRNDGCIIQAPGTRGSLPVSPYPGSASMQFVSAYDDTAGLYAACCDREGFAKQIGVEKGRDALRLAFLHYPTHEPRRE